jgi:hypothetical protein
VNFLWFDNSQDEGVIFIPHKEFQGTLISWAQELCDNMLFQK